MQTTEVKLYMGKKMCLFIIFVLLIIDIALIVFVFTPSGRKIFLMEQTSGGNIIQFSKIHGPFYNKILYILMFSIPFIVIPTTIIALISDACLEDRIKNHIYYLKTLNPKLDFSNIKRNDAILLTQQLNQLSNYKNGLLNSAKSLPSVTVSVASAVIKDRKNRKELYEAHKFELMEKHPEIDFENMTKKDKIVIDDELDVLMYII